MPHNVLRHRSSIIYRVKLLQWFLPWFGSRQLALSSAFPRHGLRITQAKGQSQQAICIQPHCLESKNLIMWTHASLCQLASELDNSHRRVFYTCSLRVFLLHQAFVLVAVCFCLSYSPDYQDTFVCEVRHFLELLTDQGLL